MVTASYSFCPAITKDGWMPTLLQDHRFCLPSHAYVDIQNIAGEIFSNAITKDAGMPAFSFDHGCWFPSRTYFGEQNFEMKSIF